MSKPRKYTIDQLREAVATSTSCRQAMLKLGLVAIGGSYQTMKRLVDQNNIDTSHFIKTAWNKGKSNNRKEIPIEEKLVRGKVCSTHKLKQQLIRLGIKQSKCEMCDITEWLGQPAPLTLDHIDGDRSNNELSNLRILCPNCHAFTPTYCGKNITKGPKASGKIKPCIDCSNLIDPRRMRCKNCYKALQHQDSKFCIDCSKSIQRKSVRCKDCENKRKTNKTKIIWPSLEELIQMIEQSSYLAVGKKLGVSDSAIRRHIESHENKSARL